MVIRKGAQKGRVWLTSLLIAAVAILLPASAAYTESDFTLGFEPTAIAINPDTEMAIISHEKDDKVTLLNLNYFDESVTIDVGRAPKGVAVNEVNNTALVSNTKDKNLSVIDLDLYQELYYSIEVGGRPQAVAVDPSRNRGVVANRQDGTISDLDLSGGRDNAVIKLDKLPIDVAIDTDLNYALVVDDVSPENDTLTVIDLSSRSVIEEVPIGRGPIAVDVDPDTHMAVVANERDSNITVINLQNWEHFQIPLGHKPSDVSLSRVTGRALVLSSHDSLLLDVDLATGRIINTYPVNRKATALAVSPYSNRAAVVDSAANSLALIQLDNPVPELQGISPAAADIFSVPGTITLTGNGFLNFSQVLLNENGVTYQLPCQFIDQHTLQANLPSEVRSHPGMFSIWVENPAPAGGSSNSVDFQVRNIIKIEIASPENGSDLDSNEVEVGGTALSGYEITEITVNGVVAAYEDGAFHATVGLVAGENTLTAIVRDAGGDTATNSITVNYTPKNQVPDPAEVAPPLDPTVATDMAAATEFLYTGSNPIQTGVAPGTIEAQRVAVLRGKVMTRDGEPLAGVAITVLNHSEYGRTFTRHDGMFDLAVNGGGLITLNYDKDGYLPIQRQVQAPWKDYAWAPDAAMIPVDPKVTTIDLGAAGAVQVARGSTMADADGTRQTALLFTPGTTAEMVLPDGSTQPLATINVRATEYTVGENGPKAMPGELPPASGYTYCVELSADEALAAGAKEVRFDRPVYFYVDNFIGFPVGGIVPVGWYDRDKAAWIPSENGRVIKVLAVAGGLADLDVTGSGQPADASALAALGITDEERREIAALYEPGKSLWRVAITHFTPWDCNWPYNPYGPPDDAQPPPSDPPQPDDQDKPDDPTECPGCVIEAESQVLGESIPIAGTSYSLNYRSDRVPGYVHGRTVEIPLSGPEVPASLKRIDLEIQVAGQVHRTSFSPAQNRRTTFVWDGKDGLGRPVQGAVKLSYRLRFVYQVVYRKPADFAAAFGQAGSAAIGGNRAAAEVYFSREHTIMLAAADISGLSGIGGWSLDPHHVYSLSDKILYQGDGTRHTASGLNDIITTVAGAGSSGYGGDGWPATAARLAYPSGITLGPDGSLYIADSINQRIRRVGPDGIITTVAGTGVRGYSGDGGAATAARLYLPMDIALGPDGSLYIAEYINQRIRRVGPDGIITTVAGTGVYGYSGDGGPATAARLNYPSGIALGPDGSLYIADSYNHWIRRVGPDGIITTVAGAGVRGYSGDGGPATAARLNYPSGIALGPDGGLYFTDKNNHRIRRVGPDGIVTTVAGTGSYGYSGDGGPATAARLGYPNGIALGPDGGLYFTDRDNHRIRRVGPDGIVTTVAGTGSYGYSGDGGPATAARLYRPIGIALGPDGSLYIADYYNHRIRRVGQAVRSLVTGEIMVPSADNSEYHVFNTSGRHLRTLDSVTGAVRRAFVYDDQGYLVRLEDHDGSATSIERDSTGAPLAIIAPNGQRTELTLDTNGYLASVANPAGETFHLAYTSGGLLTKVTKPNGAEYAYSYNETGHLTRESRPDGGGWTLSRTESENGFGGMMTSAEGRISRFDVERLSETELLRTSTAPDGTAATRLITTTETEITEVVNAADGTVRTLRKVADLRVGMSAPFVAESTVTTPGGISLSITSTRDADLSDRNDPFSFTTLSESTSVNGRTSTAGYSKASSTWTGASPQGRINVVQIDANGRPVFTRPADLNASRYAYDTRGRLTGITTGEGAEARTVAFAYDPLGNLARITDALGQATNFEYDLAGRVTAQTLPDGRTVRYTYDPNGNLAGVMPPGREAHLFAYTSTDLAEQYDPPDLDGISTITRYTYNRDKQLTAIERPDGQAVTLGYDAGGRLATMNMGSGTYLYGYSPATGKLAGITAPDGNTLAYTYDGFLPLSESWAGEISGTVSRAYDKNFWLKSLSVNGQAVNYGYDNDGLLVQAGTETLQRNALNGLLTATTLGAVSTSQDYNGFGEMETFTAARNEVDIFNTQFTMDARGRITEKVEIIEGITTTYGYVYDDAGRLVEVTENGAAISQYTYDDNGNRLSRTSGGATISGTYDAQDRMTGYDGATYEYTANGKLLRKTEGSQVTAYTYDVLGNLMAVDLPDGRKIEYLVDGNNRRIGKKIDSTLVQGFLYQDSLNPIAELDASGSVVSRFVYGSRANVPDYMVKGGVTYRIIADHLGSPRLVVDTATGDIIQRMDYDEFGNVLMDTNPGFQPFGFAGGHYDVDTGLVLFGARDYDPQTGRWTAKDPILFAGGDTNLFGYVQNDPVNFIDPLGLFNPAKGISSFGNAANAGRLYAGGVLKLGAAAGLTGTGVGAPAGTGIAALGTWNLWSAQSAWNRSLQQWNEAWGESLSDASWRNLLGVLPFGTEFDDSCEPSAWDVLKDKANNFRDKPVEIIKEIGTWGF